MLSSLGQLDFDPQACSTEPVKIDMSLFYVEHANRGGNLDETSAVIPLPIEMHMDGTVSDLVLDRLFNHLQEYDWEVEWDGSKRTPIKPTCSPSKTLLETMSISLLASMRRWSSKPPWTTTFNPSNPILRGLPRRRASHPR